jgi:hypothetical protein
MRICSRCKDQIKRGHRYHIVASRFLGFLWTVKRPAHYSCPNPTHGPSPKRLRGEVPLPFPEPDVEVLQVRLHDIPKSMIGNRMPDMVIYDSPRQELADLN